MDTDLLSELFNWFVINNYMSNLHVDSVMKSYGQRQLLTDIYISCQQGEIIGLLGRNGCGKSTLLKIIFGSISADGKFIRIGDRIINSFANSHDLIKYLPQDSFLPNHVKVSKVISVFSDDRNKAILKGHHLIKPMLHKKCNELSGGEKRLLEIYLIVYSNAKYILIDEPFNGIAPIYKESIKELIREQSKTKGFIITDHDYRNILDLASKVILLHDGGTKEIAGVDELSYWGYIP